MRQDCHVDRFWSGFDVIITYIVRGINRMTYRQTVCFTSSTATMFVRRFGKQLIYLKMVSTLQYEYNNSSRLGAFEN